MSDEKPSPKSDAEAEIEREIRQGREFTLAEAIGRAAGPGAMKGESPVARLQQAGVEIENWLKTHLADSGAGLEVVLLRGVKESELLLNDFDQPLVVLGRYCQRILDSEPRLTELVRQADIEWGRVFGERPRFEISNAPPHPDDPYTVESVRHSLSCIIQQAALGE